MNLPVPVVGVEPGQQFAIDINDCMSLIDSHDHTAGSGVQITPGGLNINTDLTINNNNLIDARSLRMSVQTPPLAGVDDLGCLYVSGVDLYYNDENGNQIQITQSGGVAGTPGSISNLTSPASASYVAADQTFVWQSAANTAANMDGGSFILRNIVANSFGITLSPPSLASNYTITLPALPASQKFMTIDASGNMAAPWAVDNSTLEIASSTTLQIKDSGVTSAKIAANNVTLDKIVARAITTGTGTVAQNNIAYGDPITNTVLTSGGGSATTPAATLTTSGRPCLIMLSGTSGSSAEASQINGVAGASVLFELRCNGSTVSLYTAVFPTSGIQFPVNLFGVFVPAAGVNVFDAVFTNNGSANAAVRGAGIVVYEMA